jgi:TolA-binding protein
LMQRAKIALEEGRNDDAINFLERIASDYGDDVLGDDAVFKLANIYEQQKVADKALKYYERLITDYPGSTFVQSARAAYARLSKGEKKPL